MIPHRGCHCARCNAAREDYFGSPPRETRREEEARLAREAIEGNARRAEALERPNRRTT